LIAFFSPLNVYRWNNIDARRCSFSNDFVVSVVLATAANAASDIVLETTYEAGHFYATHTLSNGKQLRMIMDTGGGGFPSNWMPQAVASSVGLEADADCSFDGQKYKLARPHFQSTGLPDLGGDCTGIVIVDDKPEDSDPYKAFGQIVPAYFIKGVWTFDYPAKRVVLHTGEFQPAATATHFPLGLKSVADGKKVGWPRITITVQGGQQLDMLLDTGATSRLTDDGEKATHAERMPDRVGVASYISASIFDAWHKQHPEWLVVENGDDLIGPGSVMPIIRVPEVKLGGWKVGPVWFTRRPDDAFHKMMASLMDVKPEGAIGANAFSSMRVTLDYPHETVWFECMRECRR
jgi:hypothetical protein